MNNPSVFKTVRNMPRNIVGIVITTFNRPEELQKTFDCLALTKWDINNKYFIVVIDDKSTDLQTIKLVNDFNLPKKNIEIIKIFNDRNMQMFNSLRKGFDLCMRNDCNILCNLDSDVILKPYWLLAILRLHFYFPGNLVTGININTHFFTEETKFRKKGYCVKVASGGINIMFSRDIYVHYVRPAFDKGLNWDNSIYGQTWYCCLPSVIDHNGLNSTVSRSGKNHTVASDFDNFDYIWD